MAKSDSTIVQPQDYSPARQSRWENEGGAVLPPAVVAAAALRGIHGPSGVPINPDQPRLYADLLDEADRQRRAADTILVRGMLAPRDPMP